jgi:hypothetical protein
VLNSHFGIRKMQMNILIISDNVAALPGDEWISLGTIKHVDNVFAAWARDLTHIILSVTDQGAAKVLSAKIRTTKWKDYHPLLVVIDLLGNVIDRELSERMGYEGIAVRSHITIAESFFLIVRFSTAPEASIVDFDNALSWGYALVSGHSS